MYNNVKKTYQQANFLTANPVKLVLMCYEGAISNLKLAGDAYVGNDYEAKGKALQKAIDIIDELNASLDMQKGGQIAANLRTLYNYMTRILTEADLKRDIKMFDKVVRMLEELASAWRTLAAPTIAATETGASASNDLKSLKIQRAGLTTYGKTESTVVVRAWSV